MRLSRAKRIIRFLFYPVSLMGIIMLMSWDSRYEMIDDICQIRNECYYYCTSDNFPSLNCVEKEVRLQYNGTEYIDFFEYPNPTRVKHSLDLGSMIDELSDYSTCKAYTQWNSKMYFQEV